MTHLGKGEHLNDGDVRKDAVEGRKKEEQHRPARKVAYGALPGEALFVVKASHEGQQERRVKEPGTGAHHAARKAGKPRRADGQERAVVRLAHRKEQDARHAEDGEGREDVPDTPRVGERAGAKVRREQKEGRKDDVGGDGVVKDALHEQFLFDEGHKRSVQQKQGERPGHDFRADAADAALEQRVHGALPAGKKQHAKDERRLHEELREDGE